MAQNLASMMVKIGADISGVEKGTKKVQSDFKSMGNTVSSMASSMGQSVQGFGDKWRNMSSEMKDSYKQAQAQLVPFKKDMMEVEYGFFKMAQGMKTYKGSSADFMNDVTEMGKRHKKVSDEMMKNNDFMKQSFIQTVGTMVNRSSQSEKISANFDRMNNPLLKVNNGFLKIGSNLERVARNGNASVLALKMLGPNANMKELKDQTMLINRGLMRFTSVSIVAAAGAAIFYGALHNAAKSVPGYSEALSTMSSTLGKAFKPMVEVFAEIMKKVFSFITYIAELIVKFNEAHPLIAKIIQGFILLLPALILLLSPLAIGIGLFGGLQAAFGAVMMIIGPFITGLLAMIGTVLIVAGVIVGVAAALYLLWTKTDWFKGAVLSAWDKIKSATQSAWNWIMKNVITPILSAIQSFIQKKLDQIRKFWDENGQMILQAGKNVWSVISKVVEVAVLAIGSILKVVFPVAKALVISTWNAIKMTISGAIDVILGVIKFFSALFTGNWSAMWDALKQILSGAVQFLLGFLQLSFVGGILRGLKGLAVSGKTLFSQMWSKFSSLFTNGISKVKTITKDGLDKVVSFITGLGKTFFNAGKGLIEMMKKGIENAAKSVLKSVEKIAGKIRDFLPFSPSKDGPLKDLDKLDFGNPIADSLDRATPLVKGMMSDLLTLPSINADNKVGSNINNSNTYGDIYITVPAKDIKEYNDVIDFIKRAPQKARQFNEPIPKWFENNIGRG
jgi:phage-related protein